MKNVKQFKSTILGTAILVFNGILIYQGITHDYVIVDGLAVVGLFLVFGAGDRLINAIESVVLDKIKRDNYSMWWLKKPSMSNKCTLLQKKPPLLIEKYTLSNSKNKIQRSAQHGNYKNRMK